LIPLLHDQDAEVQAAAIWALGQIGGKEARQALEELLREGDERIGDNVRRALSELNLGEDIVSL
jgi:HEAT repeat protein